jgi:hypothetical protein
MTSLSCSSSSSAHYPFKAHESEEKACVICQSEFPDKQLEELDLAQRVTKCAIPSLEETRTREASAALDLAIPVKFVEPIHNFHTEDAKGNQEDHRAHVKCAKQWLKMRSICPCCNEEVNNPWEPKPLVLRTTNGEILPLPDRITSIDKDVSSWHLAVEFNKNLNQDSWDSLELLSHADISMSKKEFDDVTNGKSNSAMAIIMQEVRFSHVLQNVTRGLNQEIIDLNSLMNLDETSEGVRYALIKTAEKGLRSANRLAKLAGKNCIESNKILQKSNDLSNQFTVRKIDYLSKKFTEMKDTLIQMNSIEEDQIDPVLLSRLRDELKTLIILREELTTHYLPFETRKNEIEDYELRYNRILPAFSEEMPAQSRGSLEVIKDHISKIQLLETELKTKIEKVKVKQLELKLAQENAETRQRNQAIAGCALVSLIALGCTYFDI